LRQNRDTRVLRECLELPEAERIWERLNRERAPEDVYGTLPGFGAWARCDPEAHPLPLWVAYRDGEPVALLPVKRRWQLVKGVKLGVLDAAGNDHWKVGNPLVGRDPERSIEALLDGLRRRGQWDLLDLGPMLQGSEMLELLVSKGRRLGLRPQIRWAQDDPVVKVTGPWDAYYGSLSSNLRTKVRQGEAKLSQEGPLRLEEHVGGPDLEATLEEFYRVESSGWKGRAGTAIASKEHDLLFYTRLAFEAAQRGWLRLYVLRAGQRCVAADYCLAYERTLYMLRVGYDERWASCSPGQVMRKRVLEHLFSSGRDEIYDMMPGGGDHRAYKMRWANAVRRRVSVRLYNPRSVRGQIAAGAFRLREWLRGRLGEAPAADRAA